MPIVVHGARRAGVRLPRKWNPNSHGARPVHIITTMIKWSWISRLLIKNSLPVRGGENICIILVLEGLECKLKG